MGDFGSHLKLLIQLRRNLTHCWKGHILSSKTLSWHLTKKRVCRFFFCRNNVRMQVSRPASVERGSSIKKRVAGRKSPRFLSPMLSWKVVNWLIQDMPQHLRRKKKILMEGWKTESENWKWMKLPQSRKRRRL